MGIKKPVVVVKLGSAALTHADGSINKTVIKAIAHDLAMLQQNNHILVVSSGAVACGKAFISQYSGTISQKKAAASIGNPLLLEQYRKALKPHQLQVAQALCERGHFANRKQFLQLKQTIETLWQENIIPIANENDVVSDLELKFSDNDELAMLFALAFNADVLLIGSSINGLMDLNGNIVNTVKEINKEVFSWVRNEKSATGLGGMHSKLTCARLANKLGIKTTLFGATQPGALLSAFKGESGTQFFPAKSTVNARQKWLAGGSLVSGKIVVDAGAAQAILSRKSLLLVGVIQFVGSFEKGEIVEIQTENNETIALAKVKMSMKEAEQSNNKKGIEVAHANEIVMI